ncbi:MAG: HAD-IC family P-type ATPase [Planctomycetia bacterium]|nr:HAD-IC family P-type ATPase [Planctomycetia bacterium]
MPAPEVAARLEVDPARGLASAEVDRRRARHGPNALPEPARRSRLAILLGQVRSPLVALLVAAAGLSFAMGDVVDACVIVAVVALNTVVGAYQEGRAERSLAALRRLVVVQVRVRRDGRDHVVDARHLVPGDVVVLAAGDKVAADARLVEAEGLRTAEAALTGESAPVDKQPAAAADATDLAERGGMVYAGTHVTAGRGLAVVVATGSTTELGRIATLTAAAVEPPTPLARRIDGFGRLLLVIAGVLLVVVVAAGLARGLDPRHIVLVGISQVVSLVPEGLPVALTIALAVGVRRMSERGAIVRRLSAVETLGSVSVICTDKTGTLTRNQMTVVEVHPVGGARVEVEGRGYAPDGRLVRDGAAAPPDGATAALVETLALCNDASLAARADAEGGWDPVGDPTEAALVTLAGKAGVDVAALRAAHPRRGEVPFDSGTRLMAVRCDGPAGPVVHVKGAPDAVLALCATVRTEHGPVPLDDARRRTVAAAADDMAARALRVLAGAVVPGGDLDGGLEGLAGRATFLGLVGQTDPPREGVAAAVAECRAAAIRAVVVTGDQLATGVAVAREIGLARDGDLARTGGDLDRAAVDALAAEAGDVTVYARVRPEQKLRIVEALQARGEVVAMTGDGVNDAPALARADVGVAMGRSGTEAAREASKVVLTDDDFATIVAAVREGRIVGRNLRKAILLQVSTSIAEVLVLLGAIALGMPLPFTAAMILWNNVVTETVITINLVLEPGEGDEMRAPPPPLSEPLMGGTALWRAALMSLTIAGAVLGFYAWHLDRGMPLAVTQTAAFTVLAVCEWFNVLNVRSARHTALDRSILRNPWLVGGLVVANLLQAAVVFLPPLQAVFRTAPLPLVEVFAIGAVGSLVLWAEEARKWFARRNAPR